ncbi:MAG: hypothetical protein WEF86_00725 [Gemmatimonadota bacterium]
MADDIIDLHDGRHDLGCMNLIAFHRVLIGAAIIFFAGYSAWEFAAFARGNDVVRLLLSAGALVAAVLLLLYLRRLKRFLGMPE